ncbi:MAG: ATP-binding cassette domain-containing protein [Limnochordia bacterium]|jgi:phosphate transport system ATP-binding protein
MMLPEPPNPLSLTVKSLTARVDEVQLLDGVSFEVVAGGTLSIVGPVNSGKSALMWAINRLLDEVPGAQVEGRILVEGMDVTRIATRSLRRRVGLLIPAPLARTPLEEIGLSLRGHSSEEVGEQTERVLRLVGLWQEMRGRLRRPYNASDPVTLRLMALARTLATSPGLLLLDDPTRGLDSIGRARFEDTVMAAMAAGTMTLIWATREPDQAGRISKKMAFLCCGQIVEIGSTESLFERPEDPRTESFLTGNYKKLLSLISRSSSRDPSGGTDS